MKTSKTILVVVAHPDDELLGLGGTLVKHRNAGDNIHILILANGEDSRGKEIANVSLRNEQATQVATCLKAKITIEDFPDNAFDSVPLLEIAKKIEHTFFEIRPEIIYTHHANDLNTDHRRTAQAVLTAARPMPGSTVTDIYAFETLSSTEWQEKRPETNFCPTHYENIQDVLEEKIELLSLYRNEMRPYPHPRSVEGVRILAQWRGLEVGLYAAEAFEVVRSVRA